ncbi:MAG: molecular chaperone DnaK [Candidatus Hydrogenedentota bacterium]|jgi:molecular chaperone DnaK|uniref:Chaperone protein DnaK n=1 Tax=Sumerlaea chitinivorans TaxID=2250252 RepID=A0A2Z4Y3R7_SUMC1|nr:Chaperone protein DnaK [Candidatus Sumerlaea chitinivorans]RMH27578.1 MAG: molecular chaperone DnaK [Candidatus Hydrogenedentota bacterium]GIX44546.1 MAG: chaperone protein DnaK [Candidatus Sumerlaea sp.]
MERVIGIDLGTTNSVVAYFEQGRPVVIQNATGGKITPSVVWYKSPGEIVVGELAKRQALTNPKQTIRSVKRFMGARFSELGEKRRGITYDLVEGPDDSVLIDVGWCRVTPEEVSAEILKHLKRTAEEFFGEPVDKAVITVPAYFNDNQRAATKRAGELAGLDVLRIINEPTAAALAYGVDRSSEQKIAVFDFGGGTFDVTILEIDKDVFEVKSTRGDTFLGGDNIDDLIVEALISRFRAETGVDLSLDIAALQRLREAAERVKCELSGTTESIASVPFIASGASGPLHLHYSLSREWLNELIRPLFPRLLECCRCALEDARLKRNELSNVLLVGGSTRIPAVQELVKEFFGREPSRTLNPDEAVAIGAAIQGAIISGSLREVLLLDVTPLSLGIETEGGLFSVIIPRNSSIPVAVHKQFTTVRDNQTSVKIHVLQGERRVAAENHSLGWFRLEGITPAPKEIPAIDVCFQIDANGLLHVSATEVTSGISNSITIHSFTQVTPEQAEEMVAAAQAAADQDLLHIRKQALRRMADEIIEGLTRILENQERPLDPLTAQNIRETIFKFDVAFSRGELPEIERAYELLKELGDMFSSRILSQRLETLEDPSAG